MQALLQKEYRPSVHCRCRVRFEVPEGIAAVSASGACMGVVCLTAADSTRRKIDNSPSLKAEVECLKGELQSARAEQASARSQMVSRMNNQQQMMQVAGLQHQLLLMQQQVQTLHQQVPKVPILPTLIDQIRKYTVSLLGWQHQMI